MYEICVKIKIPFFVAISLKWLQELQITSYIKMRDGV